MLLLAASRRLRLSAIASAVFVALLLLLLYGHAQQRGHGLRGPRRPPNSSPPPHQPPDQQQQQQQQPALPPEYAVPSTESAWCQDRFDTRYLFNARNSSASYCSPDSASRLTCFWSATAKGRQDAMCFAQRARFHAASHSFRLACRLRPLTADETAAGLPSVPDRLPRYWYETGPAVVMDQAVVLGDDDSDSNNNDNSNNNNDMAAVEQAAPTTTTTTKTTTILVKREGNANLWHSLMEIMSLSWSLDLLHIALDPDSGQPFLTPRAGHRAQVVLLDEHDDGNYIALWQLFARMPVRRLRDLDASEPPSDLVVPLAGGSNPLWQGDWDDLLCRDSALVKTFVSRALAHYRVTDVDADDADVVVTYISRAHTRRLVDEAEHMDALRRAIPHMQLNVVDFAALPFVDQLRLVRRTDLLVGVHGAGLTHLMFLRPGSTVLEILPDGFQHKGFRNLAQMLGLGFLRTHAKMRPDESGARDWQVNPVEMDRQRLIDVVAVAVKSLYNAGLRSHDV
ncbi:hypothetical protein CDD83_10693 [Cordyceps sp. RAO-2017]|nr:hypothetical protein CDD83_10693 [Cordyceps sp. RAO-2017]